MRWFSFEWKNENEHIENNAINANSKNLLTWLDQKDMLCYYKDKILKFLILNFWMCSDEF